MSDETPEYWHLWDDVETSGDLAARLMSPGEIVILIDSGGGALGTGLSLGEIIRYRKSPTSCIVTGNCQSSAALVFAACRERYTMSHSLFLFHPTKLDEQGTIQDLNNLLPLVKRNDEEFMKRLAKYLGIKVKSVKELHSTNDRWLTADRVIKLGWALPWPPKKTRSTRS